MKRARRFEVPAPQRSWFALDAAALRAATLVLVALACLPPLVLRQLPMAQLPQYLALSRMLLHIADPQYGFAPFYERVLARGPALLPLYLLGGLSDWASHELARRLTVFLSVASYPLGLWAVLRAQRKPSALLLLGAPLIYSATFFWGYLPSSLSAGMALLVIALLIAWRDEPLQRIGLVVLGTALPLTHPFGVFIPVIYAFVSHLTRREASGSNERAVPWPWLTPLLSGALYWVGRAMMGDGVAGFANPNLAYRLLHLPFDILGGFVGSAETLLLAAEVVLWIALCRGSFPLSRRSFGALTHSERTLYLLAGLGALGYLVLPASTWTTAGLHMRAGVLAFSLLPALVPADRALAQRARMGVLLMVLGASTVWNVSSQLVRFDREAQPFAALLPYVPMRSRILGLVYDYTGKVARGAPYQHFAAEVQAERGGFLALSIVDYAWTVPVRRRADAQALPPVFGSEWEPALVHDLPATFMFYDAAIVYGKEPREMTVLMASGFRLAQRSGDWLLYLH